MIFWKEIEEVWDVPRGEVLACDARSGFVNITYHIGGLEFADGYSYTHWSEINKPKQTSEID